jgi:hypothetical protein
LPVVPVAPYFIVQFGAQFCWLILDPTGDFFFPLKYCQYASKLALISIALGNSPYRPHQIERLRRNNRKLKYLDNRASSLTNVSSRNPGDYLLAVCAIVFHNGLSF